VRIGRVSGSGSEPVSIPVGGLGPTPVGDAGGWGASVPCPPGRAGCRVGSRLCLCDVPASLEVASPDSEVAVGAAIREDSPELLVSDVEVDDVDVEAWCMLCAGPVGAGAYGSRAP
jgi:hypothetical protein